MVPYATVSRRKIPMTARIVRKKIVCAASSALSN
jgi:hypothetical protein